MCGDYNGEYDGVLMNSFGSYFWRFSDSRCAQLAWTPFMHLNFYHLYTMFFMKAYAMVWKSLA